MIVQIEGSAASVVEADDLGRLHVAAPGPGDPDAALRASGLGEIAEGGDALLDIAALRASASSLATRPDWAEGWDAMVAYATTKGWLTESGQHLVAHVERGA